MRIVSSKLAATVLGLSICAGYIVYLLIKKDEDDDHQEGIHFKSNFKTLKIKLPKPMVHVLVGRNGKNIKAIEAKTLTRIEFKNSYNNTEEICIIKGMVDNCYQAENIIQEFISKEVLIECEELWVQQQYVGKIIGLCGEQIADIMSRSGAKVNISDSDRLDPRRIIIQGSKNQINVAKSLINDIIERCDFRNLQINSSLSKREPRLAIKLPGSSNKITEVEPLSPSPGQTDSPFEVYVSAMEDPSRFWVQIVGPKATELDQLVEEMTEYYSDPSNMELHMIKQVEAGDLVAAVFPYDNKWYRSEVLSVRYENENETYAELYFLDYGDTTFCSIKSIYELRTDFLMLHFQAIECYLARVEPADGFWSTAAVDYFEECVRVGQWKKLSARINGYCNRPKKRAKREVVPLPGLDLSDVVNNCDVDIAQNLVDHGFAVYQKNVENSTSSHTFSTNNIRLGKTS